MYLKINISFALFILNLKKENFDKIEEFIKDFSKDFYNKNKNYWDYEIFAKKCLQQTKPKRLFLQPKNENGFNKKIVEKYSSLLQEIFDSNLFATFFCHISNNDVKEEFLIFINYLQQNYAEKNNIIKILKRLLKIGIFEFVYKPNDELDGIYSVSENIGFTQGIFSDGNKIWLSRVDSSFPVLISGANYIINYQNGNGVLKSSNVQLKNFDFDLLSLPTKDELLSSHHPEIDYEIVKIKTNATDLIYYLNNCLLSVDDISNLSDNFIETLQKAKTTEEWAKIKANLLCLNDIRESLRYLQQFLTQEYQEKGIIKQKELEDSIVRKKEAKKG